MMQVRDIRQNIDEMALAHSFETVAKKLQAGAYDHWNRRSAAEAVARGDCAVVTDPIAQRQQDERRG